MDVDAVGPTFWFGGDFNQVNQFEQMLQCGGPFGPDSTYCATQIK